MEFSKKDILYSANTNASLPLLDYCQLATLQYFSFITSYRPYRPITLNSEFVYSRFSVEEKGQFSVLHLQISKEIMRFFRCDFFNDPSSAHISIEQVGGELL
jgi:hypothetical protein